VQGFFAPYGNGIDRRRKLKGWGQNWMSHHQIPRLDGDQAERCDGNLPFASRSVILLSMTVHWTGQALSKAKSHFPEVPCAAPDLAFLLNQLKLQSNIVGRSPCAPASQAYLSS